VGVCTPRSGAFALQNGDTMHEFADQENPTKAVIYGETEDSFTLGGYGVVFGGADLEGETFTKETDFWLDRITRTPPVLYQHGRDEKLRTVVLGKGTISDADDIGLWVETQIALAEKYAGAIRELAGKGLLGWSSGTAGHLAVRDGNVIKAWPIVEMSLTPTPAEPRTLGVSEIRSLTEWADGLKDLLPQDEGNSSAADDEPGATVTIDGEIEHIEEIKEPNMTEEIKETAPLSAADIQKAMQDALTKALADMPAFQKAANLLPEETDRPEEKSFADFLVAIERGDTKRLSSVYKSTKTALAEESGATGGYLVPTEYSSEIMRIAAENAVIRPRARVIPMMGREIDIPAVDYSGSTAGTQPQLGGIRTYWTAEAAIITESEPSFEPVKLVVNKLAGYAKMSNELAEDAPALSTLLTTMFAEAIANAEDYAFIQGDGVNQPLGIMNSPCLLTEVAASSSFVLSDAANMVAKFLPGLQNGVWLMHPKVLPLLIQLADGTTDGNIIWIPNASDNVPGTLLGRPILFSGNVPILPAGSSASQKGGVILADLSKYLIGDRGGVRIDFSPHVNFLTDQGTWRFTKRVDGQPWVSRAMYLPDGTNQVSPFVSLSGA
jgi:HK97 family phage major capsid protein